MAKNSRIKSTDGGEDYHGKIPVFIEKGKTKKVENIKKQKKVKRERIKRINNKAMDFNKGGQR